MRANKKNIKECFLFDFDRILRFLATNLLFVTFNGTISHNTLLSVILSIMKECSK